MNPDTFYLIIKIWNLFKVYNSSTILMCIFKFFIWVLQYKMFALWMIKITSEKFLNNVLTFFFKDLTFEIDHWTGKKFLSDNF